MKVKCIDSSFCADHLTIGFIYEVILENTLTYKIIDNCGNKTKFYKERFEKQYEVPITKPKIYPFLFEVKNYNSVRESYDGLWLVLAHDSRKAEELLKQNEKYKSLEKDTPNTIRQVINIEDGIECFALENLVSEIIYDCYN